MKEIADIVQACERANREGKRAALATVVQVEGSAYRREGARMLITEDGQLTGAISGGCLEGDALRKARMEILQQQALLVTYDTMDDDDAKLGVGLGCNGIIHILIEPVGHQENNPVSLLHAALSGRSDAVLVTLFSLADRKGAQPGTCLCLTKDKTLSNGLEKLPYRNGLLTAAGEALENRHSSVQNYFSYTAFVECLQPSIALVVVGAGNDAIPLTQMAAVLGWPVTIVDGRPAYALPERFPLVKRSVVAKPAQVLEQLQPDERTAFVLMTHNYHYELELLKELLPLRLPYIGMLGPKKKLERMLCELEDQGVTVSPESLDAIYGPVGLDIGSESAEEIALSIMAEIKAVFTRRNGRPLKYKDTLIHSLE